MLIQISIVLIFVLYPTYVQYMGSCELFVMQHTTMYEYMQNTIYRETLTVANFGEVLDKMHLVK